MALLYARASALVRTNAPARRFGGHGHGDGKYTFDRKIHTPATPSATVSASARPLPHPPPPRHRDARALIAATAAAVLRGDGYEQPAREVPPQLRHAEALVP